MYNYSLCDPSDDAPVDDGIAIGIIIGVVVAVLAIVIVIIIIVVIVTLVVVLVLPKENLVERVAIRALACYYLHPLQRTTEVSLNQRQLVLLLYLLKISQAVTLVTTSPVGKNTGLCFFILHINKSSLHSRRIYLRDLPAHVGEMSNDSGYKFSEEYEARKFR